MRPGRGASLLIEMLRRDEVAGFVRRARVALLLIGRSPRHSFLQPILRHVNARLGDGVRYAYAALPDLSDRAFLLRHLGPALGRRRRHLRAAPPGYYLLAAGAAYAYHPGLHDAALDWAAVAAGPLSAVTPGAEPAPLRAFRQLSKQVSRQLIEQFDPLLAVVASLGDDRLSALAILGLPPDASAAEIKAAYRREMLRCHPDRLAALGAAAPPPERAQAVNAAYRVLQRLQPGASPLPSSSSDLR